MELKGKPVVDPGFPVGGGGRGPVAGPWTPNAGAFWRKYVQK